MAADGGVDGTAEVAGKWGTQVAERGFAQIPNYLLFLNQFLEEESRLSPVELLVLIELAAAWWKKRELPFPSMATLAVRCGASERQIQRAITKLEKEGFLKRVKRRSLGIIASNAYDLSPLVELLGRVAAAFPNAFPRRLKVKSSKANTSEEEVERPRARRVLKRPAPRPAPKET